MYGTIVVTTTTGFYADLPRCVEVAEMDQSIHVEMMEIISILLVTRLHPNTVI